MPTQPVCKVIRLAQIAESDMQSLSSTMRRLRAALSQCETCPDQNCTAIIDLSSAISTAIAELTEEWNL
jgi:hypothetical protein